MKYLILSYFDTNFGPTVFLHAPESLKDENLREYIEKVPMLMDLNERSFFAHMLDKFKSANLCFEIPSPKARGGLEMLLVSFIITEGELNLDLSRDLLNEFIRQFIKIKDAYMAFYTKNKEIEGSEDKYTEIKNWFLGFYDSILDRTINYFIEALQKSEENYRTLVETSTDMIVKLDLAGNYIFINRAMTKILGFTKEENLNLFNLVHNDDISIVEEIFKEALNSKAVSNVEYRHKTKESGYIHLFSNVSPIFDLENNVNSILIVARDITSRIAAEKALKESEELRRTFMDSATDNFSLFDKNLNFVEINKSTLSTFKFRRDDIIGKNLLDISPKLRGSKLYDKYLEVIQTGKPFITEDLYISPFFGKMILSIKAFKVGVGLGIITSDITKKKKMDEIKQKALKMESLGALAGGIARDFNNILTSALGNLSLVKFYSDQPDLFKKQLAQIKNAIIQAKNLNQQLLIFSKDEPSIKEKLNISELLYNEVTDTLKKSNVVCNFKISKNLWKVEINEFQMNQVMNSLINNAKEVMNGEGIIEVSAKNIRKNSTKDIDIPKGSYIELSIKDYGAGIPEEFRDKIFDPYFSTKNNSMGLGLATSFVIIKNHGGYMNFISEIGKGTTFFIYLPVIQEDIIIEIEEKENGKYNYRNVIFMDTEESIRKIGLKMLKRLGFDATSAINKEQIIEIYEEMTSQGKEIYAIIFELDITEDLEVGSYINQILEINPNISIIASTSTYSNPILKSYATYGLKGVIRKPYDMDDLREVLKHEKKIIA